MGSRVRRTLDFLLPPACAGCSGAMPPAAQDPVLCATCRSRLPGLAWPRCPRCGIPRGTGREAASACLECREWPPVLDRAVSAVELSGPASRMVHGLKYEGRRQVARFMAELLWRRELSRDPPVPGTPLVPVPTTRERELRRGYNQARMLASALSEHWSGQVVEALERTGSGESQIALHPDARMANVQKAFRLHPETSRSLSGRTAILVDDVLTTGATAVAAAEMLQTAGIESILVVTFARTLPGVIKGAGT